MQTQAGCCQLFSIRYTIEEGFIVSAQCFHIGRSYPVAIATMEDGKVTPLQNK
jgi:hypothetical protein